MAFNFYDSYYGTYVGLKIRGTIGKNFTYQTTRNIQRKYPYRIPYDPKTPAQLRQRDLLRKATWSWHSLTPQEQQTYRNNEPYYPIMSGFNFYVSQYINLYK